MALVSYFALAWSYKPGEGQSGKPVPVQGQGFQAVMLVHPDCPCTEASLNVFLTAVTAGHRPVQTLVLIPGQKRSSRNITLAKRIPNVRLEFMADSEILRKYGISTSGHLLMWKDKELVFSGGVTDARGEDVLAAAFGELSAVLKSSKPRSETPVFGCPALNHEEQL